MSSHDAPVLTRRRFLAGAGAMGAAGLAAALLKPWDWGSGAAASGGGGPLVLITLYGGNDGLNTVIPYEDPSYASIRPTLGYKPEQVLPLGDGLALSPKLPGLHHLWGEGRLAIVRGVGYPNPSLSHFESMDIWQTANVEDGAGTGWLGRWLDSTGDDPMRAISIGTSLPPALRGARETATAVNSAHIVLPGDLAFEQAYAALADPAPGPGGPAAMMAATSSDLLLAKGRLDALATKSDSVPGPPSALSSQMQVVAELIKAGATTRVYEVSLSSFDTHANEKANHEQLLGELDEAVSGFFDALHGDPSGDRVVVMTYSEFGRRPAQNASGGTDHGTAAPLFVAGQTVRGGTFYGDEPSLTALDPNGNLVHTTDFRSVYATMLEHVLGVDSRPVLGGSFPTIPLIS